MAQRIAQLSRVAFARIGMCTFYDAVAMRSPEMLNSSSITLSEGMAVGNHRALKALTERTLKRHHTRVPSSAFSRTGKAFPALAHSQQIVIIVFGNDSNSSKAMRSKLNLK